MPTSPLIIQQAHYEDLEQILHIYNETARWLVEQGIKQWSYPISDAFRVSVEEELTYGEVFAAWHTFDPDPVGVLYLEWTPNELWSLSAPAAGYLYGLAVHPRARGQAVGERLLAWAEEHVRQRGRSYLRLDCVASNVGLRRYYGACGYHLRGVVRSFTFDRALYEKQL